MTVRLREWDPSSAPQAELDAWLTMYNRALATDMPDDPSWGPELLREYLTVTMPGERRVTWVATADEPATGNGTPPFVLLGYSHLLMLNGMGVLELFVDPQIRRTGVGTALLRVMADRAVAEGFVSLGLEVTGGTAAGSFYRNNGFNHAFTEMRSILDLTTVDWDHLTEMAEGVAHG
jgi:GNAT superfamily N-acetyltransferase